MKTKFFILLASLCLLAVPAFAQSAAELRAHMAQRLPELDALKAKELVGENNRGFVEVRGGGSPAAASVVSDENRDRAAVYALLAQQTGATPDSVGRARARQIAANSRAGVWVQDERGVWTKK